MRMARQPRGALGVGHGAVSTSLNGHLAGVGSLAVAAMEPSAAIAIYAHKAAQNLEAPRARQTRVIWSSIFRVL